MLLHAASSYTEKLLHTEDLTHSKLLHSETFTHSEHLDTDRSFYTQQAFTHSKLLQTANFYTQKPLQREAFTHRSFTQRNFLHIEAFTRNVNRNCSSKTESGRRNERRTILKHFFLKYIFLMDLKIKWSAGQRPNCWQTTIGIATFMQPLQYDLWCPAAKDHRITHAAVTVRPAPPSGTPKCIYAHGNTTWQQPCRHPAAICNYRVHNTPYLRTTRPKQLEASVTLRQKKTSKRTARARPHKAAALHRRLQPLYAKKYANKTQCFALRHPPQHKPLATFKRPLQCDLHHLVANQNVSTHMAAQHGNNHTATPMRSATADSTRS